MKSYITCFIRKFCHTSMPIMSTFSQPLAIALSILCHLEARKVPRGNLSVHDLGHFLQDQVKYSSVQESGKKAGPGHRWNQIHCDPLKVALLSQTVLRPTTASTASAKSLSAGLFSHGQKTLGNSPDACGQYCGIDHLLCIATFFLPFHGQCPVSM